MWGHEVTQGCFAGMTNQSQQKSFAQFGTWEPGDAVLTIPENSALYSARQYDRIRSLTASSPFSSVIIRGTGDRIVGAGIELKRVFWLTTDGTAIVEGVLPHIDNGGNLTWASGGPPIGQGYTVEGVKALELFVYLGLPSMRNSGTNGLPKKLLARKFDLFGR